MLDKEITLYNTQVLMVTGPARLSVIKGTLEVLGMKSTGLPMIIRKGKTLPFEPVSVQVQVIIKGENEAQYQILENPRIGTKIWRPSLSQLTGHLKECRSCRVAVIGPTDSGKSTFATFLSNIFLTSGFKVNLVDADIGQNDLGPPGSIAISYPESPLTDLRDLKPDWTTFVGYTSAGLTFKPILDALDKAFSVIKGETTQNSITILNTDGFVYSDGLQYKLQLLQLIKPHVVTIFSTDLFEVFRKLYQGLVLEAAVPEGIQKSPTDRSFRRIMQYNRFLQASRILSFDLNEKKLKFLGYSFNGMNDIKGPDLIRPGMINILNSMEALTLIDHNISTAVISRGALRNMFVGLGDEDKVYGFGLISSLNGTRVKMQTPLNTDFSTLYLGLIRVLDGNTEMNARLEFM